MLIRLDVQEYSEEENDIGSLINHIISGDEKNAIVFTFDITSKASFSVFLKKSLKAFIL